MSSDHELAVEYAEKAGRLTHRVGLLTAVLCHLHDLPGFDQIVETVCREHGAAIDWAAAPPEQEEGGTVIGPG